MNKSIMARRDRKNVVRVMKEVEELINENIKLESKVESLVKKRRENAVQVSKLLSSIKLSLEDSNANNNDIDVYVELGSKDGNGPSPSPNDVASGLNGDCGIGNFEQLKKTKKTLLEEVKTSGINLRDHHDVLDEVERVNGRDSAPWKSLYKKVKECTRIHKLFKESTMERVREIDLQLSQFNGEEGPSDWSAVPLVLSRKRSLNESVLDCGRIIKKIPSRELAAIALKKLKVEDDSPEAHLMCNFDYCPRSFTCASTLVSHLENHYAQDQVKIDCPIPGCEFSTTKENLISHIRARHSGEKLFTCEYCPMMFHTMPAKSSHERKHSKEDIWAQCPSQNCLKFYRVAIGSCKNCKRKESS